MSAKLAKTEFIGNGPVQYRLNGPIEAPAGILIRVDYADAPVPRDFYVADYFYVEHAGPIVSLVFGKMDGKDKLRTKLEIFFPAMFFMRQLWQTSRTFHESLRKHVAHFEYEAVSAGNRDLPAEKAQTLQSNNVLMVLSGDESMMDFYYISPKDMYYRPRRKSALTLEPLARVIVSPPLLLGFLDECEAIADSLVVKFGGENSEIDNLESD